MPSAIPSRSIRRKGRETEMSKEICDATKSTEVLVCLSCESRDQVNEMVGKAVAAGGRTYAGSKD